MAFPQVATTATTNGTTAATNKVCNLPSGIVAGDTLLLLIRSAAADTHTRPAGWDGDLVLNNSADASLDVWSLFYKKADGTESATVTVNGTASLKFGALAWRISGAADPTVTTPQISTVASGTSTTPNPGSVTPSAGAKDYLFMWIGSWEGEQTSPPASNPTNYSANIISANSGTGGTVDTNVRCASATRELNTASAEDPGSWTISVSDDWTAVTVIVHPAPPAPAVEDGEGYSLTHAAARVAMVLGAAVIAQSCAIARAQATAWHDELSAHTIPTYGQTTGAVSPLWRATTGKPRLTLVGIDTVIVAQEAAPSIVDDSGEAPRFVAPARVHRLEHVDEVIVAQPAAPDPFDGGTAGLSLWHPASTAPRLVAMGGVDDVVPQADPLSIDAEPWRPPFVVPATLGRPVSQWQDERVAQPATAPLDDGTITPPYVAERTVRIPVPWQYAYNDATAWSPIEETLAPPLFAVRPTAARPLALVDEVIVAQPTPVRHEEYVVTPYRAPSRVHVRVDIDEVIVVQPAPAPPDDGSIAEQFVAGRNVRIPLPWQYAYNDGTAWSPIEEQTAPPRFVVRSTVALPALPVDETIVAQPTPVLPDEYVPTFYRAPALVHEYQSIDELVVPQPAPLGFDEGTWTPPFCVAPTRSLEVSQWQDELGTESPVVVLGELIAIAGLMPALAAERVAITPALLTDDDE